MKKKIIKTGIALLLLVGTVSCKSLTSAITNRYVPDYSFSTESIPKYQLGDVTIKKDAPLTLKEIAFISTYLSTDSSILKFNIPLTIRNQSLVDMEVNSIDYEIQLDSIQLFKSAIRKGIKIASDKKLSVSLPVNVNISDLMKRYGEIKVKKALYPLLKFSQRSEDMLVSVTINGRLGIQPITKTKKTYKFHFGSGH